MLFCFNKKLLDVFLDVLSKNVLSTVVLLPCTIHHGNNNNTMARGPIHAAQGVRLLRLKY